MICCGSSSSETLTHLALIFFILSLFKHIKSLNFKMGSSIVKETFGQLNNQISQVWLKNSADKP
jgi:hypothetical protein